MIFDAENLFSKDQAVTATAGSTNVIDLGRGDAGPSEHLSVFVTASAPFSGEGGSLDVQLRTSDAVSEAGELVAPMTIAIFKADADALAAGGKLLSARLPHGMKRYADLSYVVTGTLSAGTLTAGLVLDAQADQTVPAE